MEFGHFNRTVRKTSRAVRDRQRAASDYLGPWFYADDSRFTVSDAISLGMLLRSERAGGDANISAFLGKAWNSVTRGLRLPRPETLLRTHGRCWGVSPASRSLDQLLRVRRMAIGIQDEWGVTLEGDLWGLGRPGLSRAQHARVLGLREWYRKVADECLGGLPRIDRTIALLLGWKPGAVVRFAMLKSKFSFPPLVDYEL